MSRANFCDVRSMKEKQAYVEIIVVVPEGQEVVAERYAVGYLPPPKDARGAGVSLLETSSARCSGGGSSLTNGQVTIEELTPTLVRGSFEGTGAELALNSTFVARSCTDLSLECP